jgi:hypothetical protein
VEFVGGPVLTLEWRPISVFALELVVGAALGGHDPVVVIELAPEIVFDIDGRIEPTIGLGPVIALELVDEEIELAAGALLSVGVNWWPSGGAFGAYAKVTYRILGGPTLIQQGVVNVGALFRF